MWYIILSLALLIGCTVTILLSKKDGFDKMFFTFMVWLIGGFSLGIIGYPVLKMTTGLFQNYSQGTRVGYITKLSRKGIIWKTWESQLQVGTGEMAALQEPWAFSVPDTLAAEVNINEGKLVIVSYNQWLLLPWRFGETNYLIAAIRERNDPQ